MDPARILLEPIGEVPDDDLDPANAFVVRARQQDVLDPVAAIGIGALALGRARSAPRVAAGWPAHPAEAGPHAPATRGEPAALCPASTHARRRAGRRRGSARTSSGRWRACATSFAAVSVSDCVCAQACPVFCCAVEPEYAEGHRACTETPRRPRGTCPTAHSPWCGDCARPTADIQSQLARKQHLRLNDMTALAGAPDGADAHEIFEVMHAAAMQVEWSVLLIDVQAVAEIHDPGSNPTRLA